MPPETTPACNPPAPGPGPLEAPGSLEVPRAPSWGSWTAVGPQKKRGNNWVIPCRCACGGLFDVRRDLLESGRSKSCRQCRAGRERKYPPAVPGGVYKKLTVLELPRPHPEQPTQRLVRCRCECGKELDVQLQGLYTGKYGQCEDCRKAEKVKPWRVDYHLLGRSTAEALDRLKGIHSGMVSRCYNPKHAAYSYYGGRGIEVCETWRDSVAVFLEWATRQPHHDDLTYSLDRQDCNGNYEPLNCRFATSEEQANNKTNNVLVAYGGETLTASAFLKQHCPWCSISAGIQYLKRHCPEDAIEHYRPKDNPQA